MYLLLLLLYVLHCISEHLNIADHNGIAFLGDKTQTFDNVFFCTKQEWTFVAVAALKVFIRWQMAASFFNVERRSWHWLLFTIQGAQPNRA